MVGPGRLASQPVEERGTKEEEDLWRAQAQDLQSESALTY